MRKVFPKAPRVVNKRGKNMKEMLCRAKLPPEPKSIRTRAASSARRSGFRRCGKPRCPMCPFTGEASGGVRVIKEVVVNSSNTTLTLQHSMTCQTTNCLYLLTCCKDGLQYVGETRRRIAKRFSEHRDSIHQERRIPLSLLANTTSFLAID